MDTGLWMNLFNYKAKPMLVMDLVSLFTYLVIIYAMVQLNSRLHNNLVQNVYDIINNRQRIYLMLSFVTISYFAGSWKHQLALYGANITANMLFVYMSSDIIYDIYP